MEQLLTTKLYIPSTRPKLVLRPRLIEKLNRCLDCKLSLISAPAGFGKTTLVREWVGQLQAAGSNGVKFGWLSLDDADNDPARFLAYLIAALNRTDGPKSSLGDGAAGLIKASQPQPAESVLAPLINELAALSGSMVLVLDDYHLIQDSSIHEALNFLIEHLPAQLHLVIATREDPLLPLARLRAKNQLTELRAADLRFTQEEAARFLNRIMGLGLSTEEIAALEARTEGWIAGLQLAAISMQGSQDTSGFITSFTGSHRFVLDYLIEEVLEQQPEDVQTFLLETSILSRLTGPLCDALTGQDNGQATLEMLEHTNLFIIPLDEERRWYRYHHLFVDLLKQRLRQTHPGQIPTLHQKASQWHEKNGYADEAIEHALSANDSERAATLIEKNIDDLWQRGEHANLRRWLAKLPDELVLAKPQLCIFYAWYLFASGQHDAAEQSLQIAEQTIDPGPDRQSEIISGKTDRLSRTDKRKIQGRAAAIRSFMASYQGNVPGIIQYSRLALEYLPEEDSTWRSLTAIVLGDAEGFLGDMDAAYQARFEAVEACKAAGDIYYIMLASLKLAITLREQGRLRRTMEICQQQIELASEHGLSQTSLTGLFLVIHAEVLAELNDLEQAESVADKGQSLVEQSMDLTMSGWGYMCMLRIMFSHGDLAGAEKIIQKIGLTARDSEIPPWISNQMSSWQTRIWLAQGRKRAAAEWAQERGFVTEEELNPLPTMDYFSLIEYVVLARTQIAQGRLDEGINLLERLMEAAKAGNRISRMIEILNIQALAYHTQRDTTRALAALESALAIAEPGGFVRTFVDEGPPMAQLLYEAFQRDLAPDYVPRLLAAFPSTEPEKNGPLPQSEIIEPLSEREIEVLQLIADGLTNPEIADQLYLSLNTVKVHTRNIYGKLGVHNRTQAVSRGRALGQLATG